jgi:hypothetical protein
MDSGRRQLKAGKGPVPRALLALALLCVCALLGFGAADQASGEREQRHNLILTLGGELSPLKLPRDRPAPVAVRLAGSLRTTDGATLPRVRTIELALPTQGVLDTRGLPVCSPRKLRFQTTAEALRVCAPALVGSGRLGAEVSIPGQAPFAIDARVLVFNARVKGSRAVVMHAFGDGLPVAVMLRFVIAKSHGRLGLRLIAHLSRALGPWPRFAHFEVNLSRRWTHRGERRSYLSASCPTPPRFTAGFFSLAATKLTMDDGRTIATGITRGCRSR